MTQKITTLNHLDLFTGIAGFALASQMICKYFPEIQIKTKAACDIEKWCHPIIKHHFPEVNVYDDVTKLTADQLARDGITGIQIITGGFPCQDLSSAGKQAGITGSRSSLFGEIIRLACEIRPRYLLMENVAGLVTGDGGNWARTLFGELSRIGYDAEWRVVSAAELGAPHLRKRIWIVCADADCLPGGKRRTLIGNDKARENANDPGPMGGDSGAGQMADSHGKGSQRSGIRRSESSECRSEDGTELANTLRSRYIYRTPGEMGETARREKEGRNQSSLSIDTGRSTELFDTDGSIGSISIGSRQRGSEGTRRNQTIWSKDRSFLKRRFRIESGSKRRTEENREETTTFPGLGDVVDGLSLRLAFARFWEKEPNIPRVTVNEEQRNHKLKALGNSIVPAVACIPLMRIKELEADYQKFRRGE
tara:strand:- start:1577 stop:2845 length:1269 start_codon:yes stop_codon:yes gene_type:complete